MSIVSAYDLSWLIVGATMIVLYVVLLWHTWNGNKSAWLMKMISMLLLGNFGGLVIGYCLYNIYILHFNMFVYYLVMGIGNALFFVFMGLPHYLLAVKYRTMSKNVPLVLEGKQIDPETKSMKMVEKMLLVFNIAVPVFYSAI